MAIEMLITISPKEEKLILDNQKSVIVSKATICSSFVPGNAYLYVNAPISALTIKSKVQSVRFLSPIDFNDNLKGTAMKLWEIDNLSNSNVHLAHVYDKGNTTLPKAAGLYFIQLQEISKLHYSISNSKMKKIMNTPIIRTSLLTQIQTYNIDKLTRGFHG
jgi:hypothetical protein